MPTTIRRGLYGLAVMLAVIVACAGPVAAQTGDASPDAPAGVTLTINNLTVQLLLGFLLPVAIGFAQRPTNPPWVKAIVGVALTALAVGISEAVQDDGSAVLSQEFFVDYAITQAAVIASYLGVWQPVFASRGGVNAATGSGIVPQIGTGTDRPG